MISWVINSNVGVEDASEETMNPCPGIVYSAGCVLELQKDNCLGIPANNWRRTLELTLIS
jgi:hypothetical protein